MHGRIRFAPYDEYDLLGEGRTINNPENGAFEEYGSLFELGNVPYIAASKHTCEHGDLVDIIKSSVSLSIKRGPKIRHKNLRSL